MEKRSVLVAMSMLAGCFGGALPTGGVDGGEGSDLLPPPACVQVAETLVDETPCTIGQTRCYDRSRIEYCDASGHFSTKDSWFVICGSNSVCADRSSGGAACVETPVSQDCGAGAACPSGQRCAVVCEGCADGGDVMRCISS